ncbi:AGAP011650-PA-like protein [Anopheles sinensis]|uniref:AGAP011650-PA-like protein n=1 Tax=Anopheles sinensis TaxID=74873 RepID=A0A084VIB1_ANOSI|nr:AGAP011650-PA-like protein [Anopheles sinensis]
MHHHDGKTYTSLKCLEVLPEPPAAPLNLQVAKTKGPVYNESRFSSATFTWRMPTLKFTGKPVRFIGSLVERSETNNASSYTWYTEVQEENQTVYNFTYDLFKPGQEYNVSICLEVTQVPAPSSPVMIVFRAPPDTSMLDRMKLWLTVKIPEESVGSTHAIVTFENNMPLWEITSPLYLALLVSERHCQRDPLPRTEIRNHTQSIQWPNTSTWFEASNMECVAQYQTSSEFWDPISRPFDVRTSFVIKYTIGQMQCSSSHDYCNGPLRPGTDYTVILMGIYCRWSHWKQLPKLESEQTEDIEMHQL